MLCKSSSILENKPNPHWDTWNLTKEDNLTTHQKSQKREKKNTIKLISVLAEHRDRANKEFPLPFQLFTLQSSVTLRSAELSKHVSVPTVHGWFLTPCPTWTEYTLQTFQATLTQTDPRGCEKSSREIKSTTCRRPKCGDNSKLKPMEIIRKAAQGDAGIKPFPASTSQFSCKKLVIDSFQGQLSPDLSPKCCIPLTKA